MERLAFFSLLLILITSSSTRATSTSHTKGGKLSMYFSSLILWPPTLPAKSLFSVWPYSLIANALGPAAAEHRDLSLPSLVATPPLAAARARAAPAFQFGAPLPPLVSPQPRSTGQRLFLSLSRLRQCLQLHSCISPNHRANCIRVISPSSTGNQIFIVECQPIHR